MKVRFAFLEPACETHTALLHLPFISRTGDFPNALAPKVTPGLNFSTEREQHPGRSAGAATCRGTDRAAPGERDPNRPGPAGRADTRVGRARGGPESLTVSAAAPRGGQPGPAAAGRSAATRRPSSASPWWPCPLRPRRRHRPALRPALSRAPGRSECCPEGAGAAPGLAPGALPALSRARAGHSRDEWGGRRSGPRTPPDRPAAILDPSRRPPRARPAPGAAPPLQARGPGPRRGSACAPGTAARRPARLYVGTHRGTRAAKGGGAAARETGALANQEEAPPLAPCQGGWALLCGAPCRQRRRRPGSCGARAGPGEAVAGPGVPGQGRGAQSGPRQALAGPGEAVAAPALPRTDPARREQALRARVSRCTARTRSPRSTSGGQRRCRRSGFILGCRDSHSTRTLQTWHQTCCPFSAPLLSVRLPLSEDSSAHKY